MPDLGGLLQQLFSEYRTLLQSRDSFVAACVVLWYDYALTFSREVQYFWVIPFFERLDIYILAYHHQLAAKWSWIEWLYFANRYIPLVITAMNMAGTFWVGYWGTIGGLIQILLVELILCYRLYGIYQRSRPLLIGILSVLAATTIASAAILGVVIRGGHAVVSPIPAITFCYAASSQADTLWAIFLPDIIFETIAFSCALWKTYHHIKSIKFASRPSEDSETGSEKPLGRELIEIMFQDSLLYFVSVLILFLANGLLFKFQPEGSGLGEILQGPTQSILSILGAHMLLHTREAVDRIYHPEINLSTLKPIHFAERDGPPPDSHVPGLESHYPADHRLGQSISQESPSVDKPQNSSSGR